MRQWCLGLIVALACVLTAPSCASHIPPNLTPENRAKFVGIEVMQALNSVRDIAVIAAASTPPFLSEASLVRITMYHKSAFITIHDVPNGWKPAVTTGLDQLLAHLSPQDRNVIGPYVTLLRAALKELP